jgi:hypothetical protein
VTLALRQHWRLSHSYVPRFSSIFVGFREPVDLIEDNDTRLDGDRPATFSRAEFGLFQGAALLTAAQSRRRPLYLTPPSASERFVLPNCRGE